MYYPPENRYDSLYFLCLDCEQFICICHDETINIHTSDNISHSVNLVSQVSDSTSTQNNVLDLKITKLKVLT